jgi:signal transduction histidine kinase
MVSAALPPNEPERLAALRSYQILDTDFEEDYDALCRLAATICGTPMALISLVDRDRQWFKASVGLGVRETGRDVAFCAHAINQGGLLEVPDAAEDRRFADNPLVLGEPKIRYYAGQPLVTPEGLSIGTLCTIDQVPRVLSAAQREALDILAKQVVAQLELRKALAELHHLNADKDRFVSVIAHDLRSPFSGLLGLIDLMRGQGDSLDREEIFKYVAMIHQGLHRLYNLTENLLKWALLEQGKMSFQPEEIPLYALFDEVVAPLSEAVAQKSLSVAPEFDPNLEVRGDRNMLEAALRNLVSNAVKFTPKNGRIVLSGAVDRGSWVLSVTDTGRGMDPQELARLQAGERNPSRPGTEGEQGTGLGLTLARQFAARHGGRIEFASEVGKGTTASLILPI